MGALQRLTFGRVLGSGGLATVYEARSDAGESFAVKVLQRQFARDRGLVSQLSERFSSVKRLSHPGIVNVRGVDTTAEGAPAVVMELLEGETLAQRIASDDVSLDELLRIVDELLDALIAAHGEDVVHGDVTPANVFVCNDGRVKLLDFAVARLKSVVRGDVRTRLGDRLGSAGYMPPEQIHGCHYNERGDLFAVGAIMFHTISRALVHPATSEAELTVLMGTEPARPLASVAPHAAEPLCLVVDRALAFWSRNRYPNAYTMQRDIRALRRGAAPKYATDHKDEDPREKPASRPREMAEHQPWRDPAELKGWKKGPAALFTQDPSTTLETRLIGKTLGGRYELVSLLGRGGMGAVFEATAGGARYAVKVILADDERFECEVATATAVDSRHVVRVVDADTDDATGLAFMVMELMAGTDLDVLIDEVGALPSQPAARMMLQACRGLEAAHTIGIVHRDIKPSNLFLHQRAADVTVRICDFGIARRSEGLDRARLTAPDTMLGTPLYAAPEQILDARNADARADVWSACLSLYEALMGQQPWAHCQSQGQLLMSIVSKDIPRLDELAPWVERPLADVVHRGLKRYPDERYSSVTELADALRPFAGGSERLTIDMLRRQEA